MWFAITLAMVLTAVFAINPLLRIIDDRASHPNPVLKFSATTNCYNFVYFNASRVHRFSDRTVKEFQELNPKSVTYFGSTSHDLIKRAACNLFIIFIDAEPDYDTLKRIAFRSFAQILLIASNSTANSTVIENLTRFWYIKSINVVFVVDYASKLVEFPDNDAFIDRLLRNENGVIALRASYFHCPPFVIRYKQDGKVRYDGVELRCLREIARNWLVTYRDNTKSSDAWLATLSDLSKNASDLAMCSVWQTEIHGRQYDLSSYISYQCVTLLLPNPSVISQASSIYLPFHWSVWLILIASLIGVAAAIKYAIAFELKLNACGGCINDSKYKNLEYIVLELVNVSTAHGLFRFPYHLTIQLLIFGWILLMFLLDTGYSSVFTSIMTIPQYSKPIETMQDLLDANLHWSESSGLYVGIQEVFRNTGSANLISFADRLIIDTSLEKRIDLLENRKIGKIVKVLSNKYVTDLEFVLDYAVTMSPMKECILNYYSVLAFQRDSPFTKIFDRQIGRMKAAGLFHAWFDTLISRHFNETLMRRVLDYHFGRTHGRKTLTLEHLSGAFYLLGIGLVIAIVTFVVEICWKRVN